MDFSLNTLTIMDYRVTVPADCLARTLTNLKAVAGQFCLAVTVAILVTLKLQARRPSLRPVGGKFWLAARLHQAQGISDDNEPRVIIWLRQPELRGALKDRPPPPGVVTQIS